MPDPGSEVASVPDLDSQIDSLLRDMTETADTVGRELLGDSKAGLEPEAPKAGVPVSDDGEVASQELAADLDALLSETQEELATQIESAAAEVVQALPAPVGDPVAETAIADAETIASTEPEAPQEATEHPEEPASENQSREGVVEAPAVEAPALTDAQVAAPADTAVEPTPEPSAAGASAPEVTQAVDAGPVERQASAEVPSGGEPRASAPPPEPALAATPVPAATPAPGAPGSKTEIQALDSEIASSELDLDGDFASDDTVLTGPTPAPTAPPATTAELEHIAETETTANAAGRLAQVAAPVAALSAAEAASDSAAKVKAAAILTVGAGVLGKIATGAKAAAGSSVVAKACATISKPLADKPPLVKQMVGYLALLQVFLAACVWLYTLVLRTPKVPEPTGPEVALYDPSKPVHEQASHAKPPAKDSHGAAKDTHGNGKPAAKDSHGASSKAKPAAKDSHGASSKSKASSKDSHGKPAEKAKGGGGH